MENPIISWLFETDAVRVCPEGHPFWYTSGKLGPFYINTQFLYGSEAAANALLAVIEEACAGDKLAFYDKVYAEIDKQLASCPIYAQLIDLMTEAARKLDVDFVSGCPSLKTCPPSIRTETACACPPRRHSWRASAAYTSPIWSRSLPPISAHGFLPSRDWAQKSPTRWLS